ncbi:phage tail tape measure protein, partial [bacterium]|nr:phage tail tape measure protein [bacterium]
KRAQIQLKAFGEGLKSLGTHLFTIGGAAVGAMAGAVKMFSEGTHELLEMSLRTGVSVEALSELGYAAAQSGLEMEGLEKGLRKMQKTVGEAAMGSAAAQEALAKLGLTTKDLMSLSPDRQFELIADRISRIQDPTLRAAMAMEIFGRSGTELLPLMNDGTKGIAELRKQAQALGLTVSTETAEDAAKLHEALKNLWLVAKKLYTSIGAALAPMFTALADAATRAAVTATAWIREHRSLIVTAFQTAAAIAGIGVALYVAGTVITTMIAAFHTLSVMVVGAGAFLSAMGTILVGLFSPIGLVVAAVVGLGVAIFKYTSAGGTALSWLIDRFGELKSFVGDVVQGITDALAAGDPELAAKVLWLALKVVWQEGVNWLNGVWVTAKHFFVKTAQEMWYGALTVAEQVWHGLEVAWIETVAFLSKTWTNFVADIQLAWGGIQNWLSKKWTDLFALFGSLTDEQAALAKNLGDEEFTNDVRDIENKRSQSLSETETKQANARSAAKDEHDATLKKLDDDLQEALGKLNPENDPALQATKDELKTAREALTAALEQAKQEHGKPSVVLADRRSFLDALESDGGLTSLLVNKLGIVGSFNPIGMERTFGGRPELQALKAIVKNTGAMAAKFYAGGSVFVP